MKVESSTSLNPQVAAVLANKQADRQQVIKVPDENNASGSKDETLAVKDSADQVSLNITVSKRTLDTIQKLGEVSDVLNSMAKSLRSSDQALRTSSEMIEKMKAELTKIVKNYPPFPLESAERRDLLMSYSAIQKEILQMTIPPPPPPAYERVRLLWQDLTPNQDNRLATPELSSSASDSQVRFALDALAGITDRIAETRQELGATLV
jgi:hypothetical protein